MEWQKKGIPIKDQYGKYQIDFYKENEEYTNVLNLHIFLVERADYGNYTCVASNSLGQDEETMTLYGMRIVTF